MHDSVIEAAIFDMDGLLLDSLPLWAEAEVRIFRDLEAPITLEHCKETNNMRREECIDHWYKAFSIKGPPVEDVAQQFIDALVELVWEVAEPMEGAIDLVRDLRARGLKFAIASQSPVKMMRAVSDKFGVSDCFECFRTAEDELRGKPNPAVYRTTLSKLGAPGTLHHVIIRGIEKGDLKQLNKGGRGDVPPLFTATCKILAFYTPHNKIGIEPQ